MDSQIKDVLDQVNPPKIWCDPKYECGCLGCVNRQSKWKNAITEKLGRMVTEEEFEEWVEITIDAYQMGYDCGLNGANQTNCNFALFDTPERKADWERGKHDAENPRCDCGNPIDDIREMRSGGCFVCRSQNRGI